MTKILRIAQREYIETVKTKTFILGILMVPLIIAGIAYFGRMMDKDKGGPRPPLRVAVTCESEGLRGKIEKRFEDYNQGNAQTQIESSRIGEPEQGKDRLRDQTLDVYVAVGPNIVEDHDTIRLFTHKPKPRTIDSLWTVENVLRQAVIDERCEVRGIDQALMRQVRNVAIERLEVGANKGQERAQRRDQDVVQMMIPFAFMYLMFMGIAGMGQHILSSIIEEKNSRVIEVLLSAVSPFELMAGKILGLGAIGVTVVALWGAAAYGAANWQGIPIEVAPKLMAYFVIYYVLGFLLFSTVMAAAGSICNTMKETQSLMMPIVMVLIIPMISWMNLVRDPEGVLARTMSFVPPLTPMVMILRLASTEDISFIETAGTILVLALAVLAMIWAAAKVFRTGILMYGKKPGAREILRWLREA